MCLCSNLSLSKIRSVVNDPASERLAADRERASLLTQDIEIDVQLLREKIKDTHLSVDTLEAIVKQLEEPFLGKRVLFAMPRHCPS